MNRRPPTFAETVRGGEDRGFAGEFAAGKSVNPKTSTQFSYTGAGNYGKDYDTRPSGCRMGGQAGLSGQSIRDLLHKSKFKKDWDDTPDANLLKSALRFCGGRQSIEGMKDPCNFT
jgi:hypothetical protein